jgi:hypothetical protein
MNAPIQTSFERRVFRAASIVIALASLALLPKARAVVPPPDGGYPGFNTAEGQNALLHLTGGTGNTAIGWFSLKSVTTGSFNTGVGAGTLVLNTGDNNTATGAGALLSNTTGIYNTANGTFALSSNTNGTSNTAIGYGALSNNITGVANTAIGPSAGYNVTTGSRNVYIGHDVLGAEESNTTRISNVYDSVATGRQVYVNSDNKIGTLSSSRRYKEEITPMEKASEPILRLKPVTFRYKKDVDPNQALSFGLIAEDVAKINPELITRDKNGKPQTVRYEAVNAMLLNEFLKEHRKNEAQGATIARLEKQLETVTATLQKVSAQIELSRLSARTVLNDR